MDYVMAVDAQLKPMEGFEVVRGFLRAYSNVEATFVSYRTHAERLLLWALLIRKKPVMELRRADFKSRVFESKMNSSGLRPTGRPLPPLACPVFPVLLSI
jgi:hypothetical protein